MLVSTEGIRPPERTPTLGPLPGPLLWLLLLCYLLFVVPAGTAQAQDGGCPISPAGIPACGSSSAGSHTPSDRSARLVGNPVDVVTGIKFARREDWRAFGSRLGFARSYNSGAASANVGIGSGWRHDYDVTLARLEDNQGLRIQQSNGETIDFVADSNRAVRWRSASEQHGSIALRNQRYVWEVPDGRNISFPGARPESIEWPDGDVLTLQWQGNQLVQVSDRHGRSIRLHWTPGTMPPLRSYDAIENAPVPGHLESIELPDGSQLRYHYDNLHRTRSLQLDDTVLEEYGYAEQHPYSLASLTDEQGTRQWRYHDDGRAAQFIERDGRSLSFEYRGRVSDTAGQAGTTEVRRQDGMTVVYDWSIDLQNSVSLDRVVEYPCEDCRGEIQDITPEPYTPAPESPAVADISTMEGVYVERLGASDADVRIDALGERFAASFNRHAELVEMRSLDRSGADGAVVQRTVEELIQILDVSQALSPRATVDMQRSLTFQGEPTTTICPIAVTSTCAELEYYLDLALISLCAYADAGDQCSPPGWEQLTDQEVWDELGIDPSRLNSGNFRAVIYRNTTTGEIVVGFRGSESWEDFRDDISQFEGFDTQIYRDAIELADALDQQNISVTFTGHSLGGGLATAAALQIGQPAVGFNSASLTEDSAALYGLDLALADTLVTHLLVPGDIVTGIQETPHQDQAGSGPHNGYAFNTEPWETHPAPGMRDELEPASLHVLEQLVTGLGDFIIPNFVEHSIGAHLMTGVLSAIENTIAARCQEDVD